MQPSANEDKPFTRRQLELFRRIVHATQQRGGLTIRIPYSNSYRALDRFGFVIYDTRTRTARATLFGLLAWDNFMKGE